MSIEELVQIQWHRLFNKKICNWEYNKLMMVRTLLKNLLHIPMLNYHLLKWVLILMVLQQDLLKWEGSKKVNQLIQAASSMYNSKPLRFVRMVFILMI